MDAALLGPGPTPMLAELEALAQRYAEERTRAELGQAWRPGLSKLHKLMASLEAWLGYCPAKQRRQFLQSLQPVVQAAWGLQGPLQVSRTLLMKVMIQMIIIMTTTTIITTISTIRQVVIIVVIVILTITITIATIVIIIIMIIILTMLPSAR